MKLRCLFVLFLFTNTFLYSQLFVGPYTNIGYSHAIGAVEVHKNFSYDTKGIFSKEYGLIAKYHFQKKMIIEMNLGYIDLGFLTKITQSFTPTSRFPIPGNYPIHFFNYRKYDYIQLVLKGGYAFNDKLDIKLGFHFLQIKDEKPLFIKEVYIIDYKYGWKERYGFRSDNFRKHNFLVSVNGNYKIWKFVHFNAQYAIGLVDFTPKDSPTKLYHHSINAGLSLLFKL